MAYPPKKDMLISSIDINELPSPASALEAMASNEGPFFELRSAHEKGWNHENSSAASCPLGSSNQAKDCRQQKWHKRKGMIGAKSKCGRNSWILEAASVASQFFSFVNFFVQIVCVFCSFSLCFCVTELLGNLQGSRSLGLLEFLPSIRFQSCAFLRNSLSLESFATCLHWRFICILKKESRSQVPPKKFETKWIVWGLCCVHAAYLLLAILRLKLQNHLGTKSSRNCAILRPYVGTYSVLVASCYLRSRCAPRSLWRPKRSTIAGASGWTKSTEVLLR